MCVCGGVGDPGAQRGQGPCTEHGGWSGGRPPRHPPSAPTQPLHPRQWACSTAETCILPLHFPISPSRGFILAISLLKWLLLQKHFQRNENRVHQGEKTEAFFLGYRKEETQILPTQRAHSWWLLVQPSGCGGVGGRGRAASWLCSPQVPCVLADRPLGKSAAWGKERLSRAPSPTSYRWQQHLT